MYRIHCFIGISICIGFWIVSEVDPTVLSPITPIGLKCIGTFLSMIYLWSAVESLWPSLFGLVALGLAGIGEGATAVASFNDVLMHAIGTSMVLQVFFIFVLFGAVDHVGATKYAARFLLTRKLYRGRPYMFLVIFFFCCYIISGLTSAVVTLVMMWPIAIHIVHILGIEREERLWRFFFMGMFFAIILGVTLIPFKGAPLIPLSIFETMTTNMGDPMTIPYLPYIASSFITTWIGLSLYLLAMKITHVDVSRLTNMDPETIDACMDLPPIDFRQKTFLCMVPIYMAVVLIPGFFPDTSISRMLKTLGTTGITIVFVTILILWHHDGEPMLDFQKVAGEYMNWGIFFMIAAAVYAAGTLSSEKTGFMEWVIQTLTPLFSGRPEIVFVGLMFTLSITVSNIANNSAMAAALVPIAVVFSVSLGMDPAPITVGVVLIAFASFLTPGASPMAGMMWGHRDLYSPKDIVLLGFPMCIVMLLIFIIVGYPLIQFLIGH